MQGMPKAASTTAPLVSHAGVPLTRAVTFRFTLNPSAELEQVLFAHAGAFRFAFNHQLGRVLANLDQRAAEKSYGVPDAELTQTLSWSKVSLINHINQWKDGRAPDAPATTLDDGTVARGLVWRGEVSADVFETASVNAAGTGELEGLVHRPAPGREGRTTPVQVEAEDGAELPFALEVRRG